MIVQLAKFGLKKLINLMTTVIDKELNRYLIQLSDAEKKSVLLMLKTFLRERTNSISVDQYNLEIDEALAEAASGNSISQEEMEKLASKW